MSELVSTTQELFAKHRLRCTRQRVALFDALRDCVTHPTAEELFQMVGNRSPGLSRATVYNTLDTLCESGLARRLATDGGASRFDADTEDHLHVRMRGTSKIVDVPMELGNRLIQQLPPAVLQEIERALHVKIDGISIQLLAHPVEA